jgi:peptidoglycan/LPS O-acetylase OafA/YrhL
MNATLAYRPDIDGLRAIAVLAVVLHHLSASLVPGGYVGVDVFFVISGYLITGIISREMAQGNFSFAHFYERRARRIFPALFAMLAVTVVAGYFLLLPSDYLATLRGALGTLFFSSNIVFWRDMAAGYFAATDAGLNPLLHTWSLAVEEQFYVLFPVFLLLCYRYVPSLRAQHGNPAPSRTVGATQPIVLILAVGTLVSLAAAALLVQSKSVAVFFLSPFRAWELLVGALLALNAVPLIRTGAVREAVAGTGLLAILAACFVYDSNTTFPGLAALAPVLGTAAIIHAGSGFRNAVGRVLALRPVVYVGVISYSLYLWHWPLIVLTRYAMSLDPLTPYIPLLLIMSLAVASLSFHFLEQPFRHGKLVPRRVVFALSTVFVSMLAMGSVFGMVHGGFEERFTPAVVQLDKARWPDIPFVNCEGKPAASGCTLGLPDSHPTLLLWGDSHALAWAPVLDKILTTRGTSAVLAVSPQCPPLLGIVIRSRTNCTSQNLANKNYLLNNQNIKTVVLSAYWTQYFDSSVSLAAQAGNPPDTGSQAASKALTSTIQWLRDEGKQVVLIGPVPVYDRHPPLALALELSTGRAFPRTSIQLQQHKNRTFFTVVKIAQSQGGASLRFLDPIRWLCDLDCMVMKDGLPLYRDMNHLSAAGAMALEPQLRIGLNMPAASE